MKSSIIKAIALLSITVAATIIVTQYRKDNKKRNSEDRLGSTHIVNRHIRHDRHIIVKNRAQELLHGGN